MLQTQHQHQGAARRKRQRSSSNDTTTTKERSKEQHRHSLTKHHSLEPADPPLIRSFVGSLEPMIDFDIDCIGVMHINVIMVCVNIDGPLRERERERESIMISRDSSS